jgi:hypothetical protein
MGALSIQGLTRPQHFFDFFHASHAQRRPALGRAGIVFKPLPEGGGVRRKPDDLTGCLQMLAIFGPEHHSASGGNHMLAPAAKLNEDFAFGCAKSRFSDFAENSANASAGAFFKSGVGIHPLPFELPS